MSDHGSPSAAIVVGVDGSRAAVSVCSPKSLRPEIFDRRFARVDEVRWVLCRRRSDL